VELAVAQGKACGVVHGIFLFDGNSEAVLLFVPEYGFLLTIISLLEEAIGLLSGCILERLLP